MRFVWLGLVWLTLACTRVFSSCCYNGKCNAFPPFGYDRIGVQLVALRMKIRLDAFTNTKKKGERTRAVVGFCRCYTWLHSGRYGLRLQSTSLEYNKFSLSIEMTGSILWHKFGQAEKQSPYYEWTHHLHSHKIFCNFSRLYATRIYAASMWCLFSRASTHVCACVCYDDVIWLCRPCLFIVASAHPECAKPVKIVFFTPFPDWSAITRVDAFARTINAIYWRHAQTRVDLIPTYPVHFNAFRLQPALEFKIVVYLFFMHTFVH